MDIIIKPHHLLDILKLYGKGIEVFVEDLQYCHHFDLIANQVIRHEVKHIHFTYECDDICHPCRYLKNKQCTDSFVYHDKSFQKNDFNKELDQRLMSLLHINIEKTYDFFEVMSMLKEKITQDVINQAGCMHSLQDNVIRYQWIQKGLNKIENKNMREPF